MKLIFVLILALFIFYSAYAEHTKAPSSGIVITVKAAKTPKAPKVPKAKVPKAPKAPKTPKVAPPKKTKA